MIKRSWLIWVLFILAFAAVESKGVQNTLLGDDFVYFGMARLMTEGKMPYVDFFDSHPILHVGIIYPVYAAFGYNLPVLTSIATVAEIIISLFLFLFVKERFGEGVGLLTVLLYLSTYLVLIMGVSVYGVNLTLMWTMIGIYFLKKRPFLSGIFYGLAGITMLYSLPITLAVFSYAFLKNKGRALRMFLGFLAIFGLVNLVLIFVPGYLDQVYLYHASKKALEGVHLAIFLNAVKRNAVLFFSPFLLFVFRNRLKRLRKIGIFLWIIGAYLLFIFLIPQYFDFYLVMIFPYLALLGALGTWDIAKAVEKKINWKYAKLAALIVLIGLFGAYAKEEYVVLWNYDFLNIPVDALISHIEMNSDKNETITGDVLFAPLLALETGRQFYQNRVDTNGLIFSSGIVDHDAFVSLMKKDPPRFVVARPGREFGGEFEDYLVGNCDVGMLLQDRFYGDIFLFDCRKA